jgi:hypothetical protein
VDWERIAVIVPGDVPGEIHARIVEDYARMTEDRFLERQSAAFETGDFLESEACLAASIHQGLEQVRARIAHSL